METLEISKQNAIVAFNKADNSGKSLLVNLFGKETFSQKITDRVKTFEEALALDGDQDEETLEFINSTVKHPDLVSTQAYMKLVVIARVLNEGWTPDWENGSQNKYVPWFKNKSGFGLACCDYGRWSAGTGVGSRLCFKTSDLAEYAGKQFKELYEESYLIG